MKHWSCENICRLLLTSAVAVLALFLLGADFPEHHTPDLSARETAAAFCDEFAPEFRDAMGKTAAADPYLILQIVAE